MQGEGGRREREGMKGGREGGRIKKKRKKRGSKTSDKVENEKRVSEAREAPAERVTRGEEPRSRGEGKRTLPAPFFGQTERNLLEEKRKDLDLKVLYREIIFILRNKEKGLCGTCHK